MCKGNWSGASLHSDPTTTPNHGADDNDDIEISMSRNNSKIYNVLTSYLSPKHKSIFKLYRVGIFKKEIKMNKPPRSSQLFINILSDHYQGLVII